MQRQKRERERWRGREGEREIKKTDGDIKEWTWIETEGVPKDIH